MKLKLKSSPHVHVVVAVGQAAEKPVQLSGSLNAIQSYKGERGLKGISL